MWCISILAAGTSILGLKPSSDKILIYCFVARSCGGFMLLVRKRAMKSCDACQATVDRTQTETCDFLKPA
jgi:hypothetical protein